jgi:hypothetical protein
VCPEYCRRVGTLVTLVHVSMSVSYLPVDWGVLVAVGYGVVGADVGLTSPVMKYKNAFAAPTSGTIADIASTSVVVGLFFTA